jgi:RimJ/RimL family protein N-acetyltransferase
VIIETERLRLRPLTIADEEEMVALHSEPKVARFLRPLDREQVIERLQAYERHWSNYGYGLLTVLQRDGGRFLGRVGLMHWPHFGETEVGWALHPGVWGRGYATEAARASVAWAFRDLNLPYLTAMIRPGNARSVKVAERLGMTPLRADLLHDTPVDVYSVSREDWQASGLA